MSYDIELQRYRDLKIRVCNKDSIPLCLIQLCVLKRERVVLLFDVFPSNHVPGVRCPADYVYIHNNGLPT